VVDHTAGVTSQPRAAALLVLSLVLVYLNRTHRFFPPVRTSPDVVDVGRPLVEYLALVGVVLGAALLLRGRRPGTRAPSREHRAAWGSLVLGVVAVATYLGLAAAGTGIGAPTDIGGGLILLAGYALTGVGILVVVLADT
jgi:hypothetical protein